MGLVVAMDLIVMLVSAVIFFGVLFIVMFDRPTGGPFGG